MTTLEGNETMTATRLLTVTALMLFVASTASAVHISEIRIDMSGADNDEYVELAGDPGESLDGLTYIVLGDLGAVPRCGGIECVVDLTGWTIQADGLLSIGDTETAGLHTFTYDVEGTLNFENSDNVTHMIVEGFYGAIDDDVDTDDDCVIDTPFWTAIIDDVALYEGTTPDCMGTDECWYSAITVGPDGQYVPGHVYLCPEGWLIGGFALGSDDTPGEQNNCPIPVESSTWGGVKSIYRD
jgi:hypothetical protein